MANKQNIKRSPEDMEISVKYTEDCQGCKRCRSAVIAEVPQWRWWHMLTGAPKIQQTSQTLCRFIRCTFFRI